MMNHESDNRITNSISVYSLSPAVSVHNNVNYNYNSHLELHLQSIEYALI